MGGVTMMKVLAIFHIDQMHARVKLLKARMTEAMTMSDDTMT